MSENQNSPSQANGVVLAVNIPPRPALYMALQHEIHKEEPDVRKIAELINRDVAMASRLLEMTNSALFNMRRQITSVQDAVSMIGMDQTTAVMSGLITRQSLARGAMMMARFWDVSEKRAKGMSYLSKELHAVRPEIAYSFGLFCDIGIPLLKATFPAYVETLSIANHKGDTDFLEVEHVRHDGLDHAYVGAILAQQWGIDDDVVSAISMHHNHDMLYDEAIAAAARALVAMNYVVEKAIQEYRSDPESLEWMQGGTVASEALELSESDVDDLCEGIMDKLRH